MRYERRDATLRLSNGHAHASLRRRAKEEAALDGRPEGTLCVLRVVTARGGRGVFLHVAGRRAIGLSLAWGETPVLVRLEAGLRDKACKRGQLVVAEEGRDGQLRRLLTLELALGVGHGLEGEVRAVVAVFGGENRVQLAARLPARGRRAALIGWSRHCADTVPGEAMRERERL